MEPDPGGGPPGRLYVPTSLREWTIHWGHTSKFSYYPCTNRTMALLRRPFWWPLLNKDVEYFSNCQTCNHNKSSHQSPAVLLQPLSFPARRRSHIALDFITGLPMSNGKNVIHTIIERFSKTCCMVALSKLPSSAETVWLCIGFP